MVIFFDTCDGTEAHTKIHLLKELIKKGVIILKKMFDFRVVGICLVALFSIFLVFKYRIADRSHTQDKFAERVLDLSVILTLLYYDLLCNVDYIFYRFEKEL